jgi:hypothetical protein
MSPAGLNLNCLFLFEVFMLMLRIPDVRSNSMTETGPFVVQVTSATALSRRI